MQSCRVLPRSGGSRPTKRGVCLSTRLTRQTCMKSLPKYGTNKANMHEVVCLSMRLTRQTCMKNDLSKHWVWQDKHAWRGLPKHGTNKVNMHDKRFV